MSRELLDQGVDPTETGSEGAIDDAFTALGKAIQFATIASDWNLDEVEIEGEMVDTHELREEFEAARKGLEQL